MSLLTIHNLCFNWSNQPTLLQIDEFTLQANEKLFLYGPSGSGKTTLLSLISGTQLASKGDICLLGKNLSKLSTLQRDKWRTDHTGYIFQQFNLLPFLSVLDNVILPCNFSKLRQQRAIKRSGNLMQSAQNLLTSLGINQNLWSQKAEQLSIGQQQRVAAARALIGSPELIIADEPTSALDFDNRTSFLELLFNECAAANSGLLFVSHDQNLAQMFNRSVSLTAINKVKSCN